MCQTPLETTEIEAERSHLGQTRLEELRDVLDVPSQSVSLACEEVEADGSVANAGEARSQEKGSELASSDGIAVPGEELVLMCPPARVRADRDG
jgi:type IV secretory pathway protease TraF